jgi:hypothetical protein
MQAQGWIDHNTRAVRITVPLYNTNAKVFVVAKFTIRFDLGGGMKTMMEYNTYVPTSYTTTEELTRLGLEVLIMTCVCIFAVAELYKLFYGKDLGAEYLGQYYMVHNDNRHEIDKPPIPHSVVPCLPAHMLQVQ